MSKNSHATAKVGILLVNLGTPTAPTTEAVKKYLAQFLADPYVVTMPRWLWLPILHGFVLKTRPRKSVELYQKIWTQEGSPLLVIAKKQVQALEKLLKENCHQEFKIVLGMRYGTPSIDAALAELHQAKITKLIILPLYPQYSLATTASTFATINKILKMWHFTPELHFINQYADNENYISLIANSIKHFWQKNSCGEKLLFSFHGLPKKSISKGDPYYFSCNNTAALVAKKLQLTDNQWQVVFQSRFGAQKWLEPYCDKTLLDLPQHGIKKVDIVCPGFAADCLETLEEINIRNRETFLSAGGNNFNYIPALNDSGPHIEFLADLICDYL